MDIKYISCRAALIASLLLTKVGAEGLGIQMDQAEVRMPYGELRKLWEAARDKETKNLDALVSAKGALISSKYTLDIHQGMTALVAEFKVESYQGKWESIPLMGCEHSMMSVEPGDASFKMEDGNLCYVAREKGPATLKVRFHSQPIPLDAKTELFRMVTVPGVVSTMEIRGIPADRLLKVDDVKWMMKDQVATISLPMQGGLVSGYLIDKKDEVKPAVLPPITPSEWVLKNEVLAYEGERELCYRVKSYATAVNGSAVEMHLKLPSNTRGIRVEKSDDLSDWKVIRKADGMMELELKWTTRDVMERDLNIQYAIQKIPLEHDWELKAPSLIGGGNTSSFFMYPIQDGVELKADGIRLPVPVGKLSSWVSQMNSAKDYATISAVDSVQMHTRFLPRVNTAVAVIHGSNYISRIVDDGSMITEAHIQVDHDTNYPFEICLPKDCELLKCEVNDKLNQPIARENSVMEILLKNEEGLN